MEPIKVKCSWYSEDNAPNKTVSLGWWKNCNYCKGKGWIITASEVRPGENTKIPCLKCGGDGKLSNMIPFNSQLMTCALAPSFAEKYGLYGKVLKVTRIELPSCSFCDHLNKCGSFKECNVYFNQHVIVWANDTMSDHVGPDRVIDLTKDAFSRLAPTDIGVIDVTVEVVS